MIFAEIRSVQYWSQRMLAIIFDVTSAPIINMFTNWVFISNFYYEISFNRNEQEMLKSQLIWKYHIEGPMFKLKTEVVRNIWVRYHALFKIKVVWEGKKMYCLFSVILRCAQPGALNYQLQKVLDLLWW